ncbi:MAG: hypothetical protein IH974_11960, partial [Myxococcales bacterium]|nr:hypothetical protein [Myxococcales bacterium]
MKRKLRRLGRELASLLVVALWAWVGAPAPAGAFDCTGLTVDPTADDDNDGFTNDQECDNILPAFSIFVPAPTSGSTEGTSGCEVVGSVPFASSGRCEDFSLAGGPFTPDLFVNFFPTSGDPVCSLFPDVSLLTSPDHDPLAVLRNGLDYVIYRDVVDPALGLQRRISPNSPQRLLRLLETGSDGPIGEFGSILHDFVNGAGDGVIHTGTICRFVLEKCPTGNCSNTANDPSVVDSPEQIVRDQIANTVAHECGHGCAKLTRKVSRKNGPHEGVGSGRVMEKFIDVSCKKRGREPCDFGIS